MTIKILFLHLFYKQINNGINQKVGVHAYTVLSITQVLYFFFSTSSVQICRTYIQIIFIFIWSMYTVTTLLHVLYYGILKGLYTKQVDKLINVIENVSNHRNFPTYYLPPDEHSNHSIFFIILNFPEKQSSTVYNRHITYRGLRMHYCKPVRETVKL